MKKRRKYADEKHPKIKLCSHLFWILRGSSYCFFVFFLSVCQQVEWIKNNNRMRVAERERKTSMWTRSTSKIELCNHLFGFMRGFPQLTFSSLHSPTVSWIHKYVVSSDLRHSSPSTFLKQIASQKYSSTAFLNSQRHSAFFFFFFYWSI